MKTQEKIAEEVINMLNSIKDGSGVDGETMHYILKKTSMEQQMHRQLVLSFPRNETKALLDELAKLNGEFSEEEIRNDRGVIIAAVSVELYSLIKEEYDDWLDENGHYAFYDLVVTIVDELLFAEGSMYQRFMKERKNNSKIDFYNFSGNCFDWYHMGTARKMVTKELLHSISFADADKYFDKVRKKFYELAIDEGEELGTRTLKNFDTKEEAEVFKKDLEKMFPRMKLFIDTCTYDYMIGNK